jgi:hypothetical protein
MYRKKKEKEIMNIAQPAHTSENINSSFVSFDFLTVPFVPVHWMLYITHHHDVMDALIC